MRFGAVSVADLFEFRSRVGLDVALEDHDAAAQRQALDELYASESSDLPPGAHHAQARIVTEWDE